MPLLLDVSIYQNDHTMIHAAGKLKNVHEEGVTRFSVLNIWTPLCWASMRAGVLLLLSFKDWMLTVLKNGLIINNNRISKLFSNLNAAVLSCYNVLYLFPHTSAMFWVFDSSSQNTLVFWRSRCLLSLNVFRCFCLLYVHDLWSGSLICALHAE